MLSYRFGKRDGRAPEGKTAVASATLPEFTVAVCTRNRSRSLSRTLESVARQEASVAWETLVVDNGSTDDTAERVRARAADFPVALRLEHETVPGAGAARNRALAAARGRVLLFADDDVTCRPGWLAEHVRAFADPNVIGSGGRILPNLPPDAPQWLRDALPKEAGGPTARYDFGMESREILPGNDVYPAFTANMGVARDRGIALGGFRTDLGPGTRIPFGEDVEFFSRLMKLSGRCLYLPDAVVDHHIPPARTTREYYFHWYQNLGRASIAANGPMSRVTRMGKLFRYGPRRATWALRSGRRYRNPYDQLDTRRKFEHARGRCLELLGR